MTEKSVLRRKITKKRLLIAAAIILMIFVIVAIAFVANFSYILRSVDENRKNIVGLYAEPKNSLDVIYVGASSIYLGWSPLQAYSDYGIASYALATRGMPASLVENMIIEAEKTQEPKLYVIDASPFMQMTNEKVYTPKHIFRISNSLKYSFNRFDAINTFMDYNYDDFTMKEKIKLHFDFIANRHKIGKVKEESVEYRNNNVKSEYKGFRISKYNTEEITLASGITELEDTAEIEKDTYEILDDLIEYADKKDIDLLFTYPPRYIDEEKKTIYNTIENYVTEKGCKFYDSMDDYKDMDIDLTSDFRDKNHFNYTGASKYTDYFGEYLTDNYELPDRRDNKKYDSWDEDHERYSLVIRDIYYTQGITSGDMLYTLRPVYADRKGIAGLYAEEKNTIDVMYIGASSVFKGWSPLQAWNDHGFTSYSYGFSGTPAPVMKNMIIETEKTQSPQLYILDVSPFMQITAEKNYSENHITRVSDSFSYSVNRSKALSAIKEYTLPDLTAEELKTYEFDILRNQYNADSLDEDSYKYANNDAPSPYKGFRLQAIPPKAMYLPSGITESTETTTLDDPTYEILDDLIAYIEKNELEVLFTYPPRYIDDETKPIYNTIEEYVKDKGYKFYDSMDFYKEMDIDFSRNLYNGNHVNYLGAVKYTDYFAEYLVKKYDLPDKREQKEYSSWNESYKIYKENAKEKEEKLEKY